MPYFSSYLQSVTLERCCTAASLSPHDCGIQFSWSRGLHPRAVAWYWTAARSEPVVQASASKRATPFAQLAGTPAREYLPLAQMELHACLLLTQKHFLSQRLGTTAVRRGPLHRQILYLFACWLSCSLGFSVAAFPRTTGSFEMAALELGHRVAQTMPSPGLEQGS